MSTLPLEKMNELLAFLNAIYPISAALRADLLKITKFRTVKEGDCLLKAGETCTKLLFVHKGVLRCYYLEDGEEISSWFMMENDACVSIFSFYRQVPSDEYIQALTDCELFSISFEELEWLYEKHLEFNVIGRKITLEYFLDWNLQLQNIKRLPALERYELLLNVKPQLVQRIPLKYLASYLDMKPETLSRMRGKRR